MKVYSMKGELVDMAKLAAQNADMVAIGNAKMNARGDLLGTGGVVVKRRQQISDDYYANPPKAVKAVALKDIEADVLPSPAQALAAVVAKTETPTSPTDTKAAPKPRRRMTESEE